MQFLNYFFASIITFFGLIIGIFLARIAPEEQKPLEKYMKLVRKILLAAIIVFLAFYFYNNIFYLSVLLAYFLFLIVIEFKLKDILKKSIVQSGALGVIFFLSSKNMNLFAIETALILLAMIPTASLVYIVKERNHAPTLFYNLGFIIISNILFFI